VDPAKIHILVLDRNPKSAHSIGQILKSIGYQVFVTTHQSEAVALAEEKLFNLVVKAFDPDAVDAIALMDRIRAITPDTQFIFISEKGSIQVAVDAIRKGAYDYLSKPINPAQLIESVRKALDFQALIAEDQQIKMRLRRRSDPDIFAGSNSVMSEIDQLIRQVATTDVTVLIEGESGTGKEIVARVVHERSRRSARPFMSFAHVFLSTWKRPNRNPNTTQPSSMKRRISIQVGFSARFA
jgi:DNA-binding NtrC family response regulator